MKNKMPLIALTVNTNYNSNSSNVPFAMEKDGSFRLSKKLEYVPPKETIFYLRKVFFDAGGQDSTQGGRNKTPTIWMSLDFPQLETYTHTDINAVDAVGTFDNGIETKEVVTSNDFGVLKFPLVTYPINGGGSNPNRVDRKSTTSSFEHKSNHITNIPIGKMNLENGFLECVITPRERGGKLAFETRASTHLCRFRQAQIILEYN